MPTTLGFLVLGFVRLTPASGFDLRRVFATTPLGNFSGSPGAIYPLLARLKRERLLKGMVDRTNPRRPRTVYRITAAGTAALREWVKTPIDAQGARRYPDLFGIRVAFMEGGLVSDAERREILASFEGVLAAEIAHLGSVLARIPPTARGIRSLLVQAQAMYRFRLRWVRSEQKRPNTTTRRKR
jgi:DNA-binding PadR family transcriptional regulator